MTCFFHPRRATTPAQQIALTSLLCCLCGCPTAYGASGCRSFDSARTQTFDIPPGSLATVLNRFAQATDCKLIYDSRLTEGLRHSGLTGTYATSEALRRLLQGTGLNAQLGETGVYTIVKAMPGAALEPRTLPSVIVEASAGPDSDPTAYHRPQAMATKTDAPPMAIPFSVATVPTQVVQDQQLVRLDRALQNVAGVQPQPTNGLTTDAFIMRGFQTDALYRNGLLSPSAMGGGTSKREMANIERVEVLRGPSSILYGRSEPGGIINLVTKKPSATPYRSLQQQFGSYDFYRTTADLTGPLSNDGRWLYRANLAYENADSFRDFQASDRVFFAPSLSWSLTPQTEARLDLEYQHFDETGDSGIPPIGNRPAPVPRSREVGEKLNNRNRGDRTFLGLEWSHAFSDRWKLLHRFGTEHWDFGDEYLFFYTPAAADGTLDSRSFNNGNTRQQTYQSLLNLTGHLDWAGMHHELLFGFDHYTVDNQGEGNCCLNAPLRGFNLFHPTYLSRKPALPSKPSLDFTQSWQGLYVQNQVSLPYGLHAQVGLRYDRAHLRDLMAEKTISGDERVSPRGGLLWQPRNWLSLYGSYSENYGAPNTFGLSRGWSQVRPQTAQQWELGAKTQFRNDRLSARYAYFDLSKRDVGVVDVTCQPAPCIRTVGEQQSRGHELEIAGEVLPGWRVIGAYTHLTSANVTRDGLDGRSGDTGNRLFMTPRNFGSLWTTYEFEQGQLEGLKLGGGIVASSQSQGSNSNDFQVPGYATVSLLISHALALAGTRITTQLNVENLLDKTYYRGTNTGHQIGIGAPRTFLGSMRIEF